MILIPEIKKVVILVPKNASGTIKEAVKEKYPESMMVYRHMEADGVPHGYDNWERIGLVRHPIDRLWGLFNYLRAFDGDHPEGYVLSQRESVNRTFSDWMLNNEIVFTAPYDRTYKGLFYPKYTVLHSVPENRKSQFMYLRPDLGTKIFQFSDLPLFFDYLGLDDVLNLNVSEKLGDPELSKEAAEYSEKVFSWDLSATY